MLETAYLIVALAALAKVAIGWPFAKALREEAPELLSAFVLPKATTMGLRREASRRYRRLILFREYRSVLAACPKSRAWASWLFLVHWVQLVTVAVFFIGLLVSGAASS
jgi:hypothetical protein